MFSLTLPPGCQQFYFVLIYDPVGGGARACWLRPLDLVSESAKTTDPVTFPWSWNLSIVIPDEMEREKRLGLCDV
jgi:hypothetical protein